jgi:hypothetical protein
MEANGEGYEVRSVPVRSVRIPAGHEPDIEGLAVMHHNWRSVRRDLEMGAPVMVLERGDGSLWTYDDVHKIATAKDLAPDLTVSVVIIGQDPTPPAAA